jgi:predicted  nucleic acid-binding Zn-ribbon protein
LNEAEVVAELIEIQTDDSKRLQQSVNDVTDALAKLQQAMDEVSESRQGEREITLIPGETIDLEYFRKIKQLLNEAKGLTEKILTADNGITD